jgi:hypothetical protein
VSAPLNLPGRSNHRRWLIRGGLIVVVGLGIYLYFAHAREERLTVVNRSGQVVRDLKIRVGEETVSFHHLAVGAERSATFRTGRQEHFVVEGELADGTMIRGTFGREASGEEPRFVLEPGGHLTLDQKGKRR